MVGTAQSAGWKPTGTGAFLRMGMVNGQTKRPMAAAICAVRTLGPPIWGYRTKSGQSAVGAALLALPVCPLQSLVSAVRIRSNFSVTNLTDKKGVLASSTESKVPKQRRSRPQGVSFQWPKLLIASDTFSIDPNGTGRCMQRGQSVTSTGQMSIHAAFISPRCAALPRPAGAQITHGCAH